MPGFRGHRNIGPPRFADQELIDFQIEVCRDGLKAFFAY